MILRIQIIILLRKSKGVIGNEATRVQRGFKDAIGEYNVNYWVKDIESLIFWLKAIDMPASFNMEDHWQQINEIVAKFTTPKGIISNEHRQLLIIQKV